MADDTNSSEFKLNLDVADAIESVKKFSGSLGEIGEAIEPLISIAEKFGEIALALAPIAVGVGVFKKALDLSMEAEQIQAISESFEQLSRNAGLSGSAIQKAMEEASGGIIPTTELLQAGNKAIIQLGENASHAGELMAIARQASAVFGGTIVENFDNIARAVGTGNTRLLKHIGLTIDANQAYETYAKSLGVSVEALTEANKQQAILNAVLEKAKTSYEGVNPAIKENTNLWLQFKATMSDVSETFTLALGKLVGPAVKAEISGLAAMAKDAKRWALDIFGSGSEATEAHAERVTEKLYGVKQALLDLKSQKDKGIIWSNEEYQLEHDRLSKLESEYENDLKKNGVSLEASAKKQEQISSTKTNTLTAEEQKARDNQAKIDKEYYSKLHELELKHEQDANKAEAALIQSKIKSATTVAQADSLYEQKKLNDIKKIDLEIEKLEVDKEKKLQDIQKNSSKMSDDVRKKLISETKKTDAQLVILQQQRIEAEKDSIRDKQAAEIDALTNAQDKATTVYAGITTSAALMAKKASNDIQNFGKQGELVMNTFSNNAISGLEAIGSGAESAGDAMKGFMFSSLGDIAEAEGRMMMLAGLMHPGQMAAGAALVVLGSWLKSQGKSTSSSVPSSGGGDSSIAVAPNPATVANPQTGYVPPLASPAAMSNTTNNIPQRSVTINIAGHVLSGPRSADWLVAQIRQAADASDFKVQSIGGGL